MPHKPADQSKLAELINDYEDAITEPFHQEVEAVTRFSCPRCGGNVQPEADIQRMLRQGSTRYGLLSRCTTCGCLTEPDMGIIVELGNLGRVEPAIPLIHPDDEY
jgi:predicted RNA-binding Zn-ribbon protein involved in translation (DUF1610 family)